MFNSQLSLLELYYCFFVLSGSYSKLKKYLYLDVVYLLNSGCYYLVTAFYNELIYKQLMWPDDTSQ